MNILQVYPIFNPEVASGAAKVAYEISKRLVEKGHDVTFLTSDMIYWGIKCEAGRYTINNISVYRLKTFAPIIAKKYKISITPQLLSFCRAGQLKKFDVVHLHAYRSFQNIIIHHYAKKYGIPYVLQAHGSLPRINAWQTLKWLYDILFGYQLLRDAAKVIALSRVEAEQYRAMGVPEEKIVIIPNGIDISEYAELPPKGVFKKKFNIPEDRKIILYLGRIHKAKGIDFLIRAYAYLKNKMNFKDAILVIAGPDDGFLDKIKSLVRDLGVANSVLFTGLLSEEDKIKAYVDSDVVINVEPLNVYGLVPLEAAACSTPVIVSKTNAISEIILNGKFGFSVRYGGVVSLASTLYRVLIDEKLAKNLGKNGRDYVFSNFGWDKIIEKYVQLYDKVISGRI